MSRLDDIGEQDQWRCWICDEAVDPDMSVNDARGPSIDQRVTKARAKKKSARPQAERLAHRGCNTGKGAKTPEIPWPEDLFVVDPVDIVASVERLVRKGGRETMGRATTAADAQAIEEWIVGRIARLEPDLSVTSEIQEGAGQFLVALRST